MSGQSTEICAFNGCTRPKSFKGLCKAHYNQQYLGKPLRQLASKRPNGTPPRFSCVPCACPNPHLIGECLIVQGKKTAEGYIRVGVGYKNGVYMKMLLHRYLWEQSNGPIPDSLVIDHQCRNRACVNLNHLRVVTAKQNSLENVVGSAWQITTATTHCPRGHHYDTDNTYHYKGRRHCRICRRECHRRWLINNKLS